MGCQWVRSLSGVDVVSGGCCVSAVACGDNMSGELSVTETCGGVWCLSRCDGAWWVGECERWWWVSVGFGAVVVDWQW